MTREEFALLIKENNNHLRIKELRTSPDGGLDWSCNYWNAAKVIIVTANDEIFRLSSIETRDFDSPGQFLIGRADSFQTDDYPFVIRASEQCEIYIKEFHLSNDMDEIVIIYDNCHVSVVTEEFWGGVGLSLQGNEEAETHLEYVDYEYSYTWDFKDVRK